MFTVRFGQAVIPYKSFIFNGGEVSVKLDINAAYPPNTYVDIKGSIESSNNIMELILLIDAIRRKIILPKTHLYIPYFPYARQDRVMVEGESLSVKVMADLINSLNLDRITIVDPHSDVTPALLNNCNVLPQWDVVRNTIPLDKMNGATILVAPDAGAIKKVSKLSELLHWDMVRADKLRDVTTGQITETVVYTDHVDNWDFFIVDDICDGGRTFIELAKVLRTKTNGSIYLYVTHGIFSQGLDVFNGIIDKIYCPYVFKNVKRTPILCGDV